MNVVTSVKIDKNVKEKASKLADDLGINLSIVINNSLKRFISEKQMLFSLIPECNEDTKKEIQEIRSDIKNKKNLTGPFENIEDFKESLLA